MSWKADPRLQDLNRECRQESRTYLEGSTGPSDTLCTDNPFVCDVLGCNVAARDDAGLLHHCETVSHLGMLQKMRGGATPSPWALLKLPPGSSPDAVRGRYRAVIRRWHTDHCPYPGAAIYAQLLTQAYNGLKAAG